MKKIVINEPIAEVALLTSGLQPLAVDADNTIVYQHFFADLFKWLRFASSEEETAILNEKLLEHLSGEAINQLTASDKTLFLATRLQS